MMRLIRSGVKPVMLVSGLLTCTMLYAAVAPQAALQSSFGATLQGPVAEVVVRNWGILIGLVGGMLVYGAFRPAHRPLILVVAGLSKIAFIALVLSRGGVFLGHQAGVAAVVDTVMVILFATFLFSPAGTPSRPS